MKRSINTLSAGLAMALGLLSMGTLTAEERTFPVDSQPLLETEAAAPRTMADNQPQIAYRIFSDYVDNKAQKDAESRTGWGIGFTIAGGLALGTAGVIACIDPAQFDPRNPDSKWMAAGIIGGNGLIATGVGIALLATPVPNLHVKYRLVFEESDPLVQEALAASTLKEMAQKGREGRIISGISTILSPLVYMGVMAIIDGSQGRDPWYSAKNGLWWLAGSAVSGGISLFSSSTEERLWDKYIAARDAMYAIPGGHK